jgi:hypothetical protein
MKETLRAVAAALGVAAISLGTAAEPLVIGRRHPLYHWAGTAFQLFGPVVFDLFLFWAIFSLILLSARSQGRWRIAVWMGVVLLFLPRALLVALSQESLDKLQAATGISLGKTYWTIHTLVALSLWILLIALWRPRRSRRYETAIGFCATVLAFLGISGALLVLELGLSWSQAYGLNKPKPLHAPVATAAAGLPHHRVIWVLMDEMSQDQVFDHRYPGLQLPAIDALAQTSTVFTQVAPAGFFTELAVPSLLSGDLMDDSKGTPQGNLLLHLKDTGQWRVFDGHHTIFVDALRAGYNTGVAGWYNPYCRTMSTVLTSCTWANGTDWELKSGMMPDAGFFNNATVLVAPLAGRRTEVLLSKLLHDPALDPYHQYGMLHLKDYQGLVQDDDRFLQDPSLGFVFLHLPIPHPGGIYDRVHHQFSNEATTYVDNLALADEYLGHLRTVLEQSGQWDSSDVVIMGDHSWRTQLWKSQVNWTEVEQKASGGNFDSRPFYLVKLAGQHAGLRMEQPFQAIRTREMFDQILEGTITTPEQLSSWAAQAPGAPH